MSQQKKLLILLPALLGISIFIFTLSIFHSTTSERACRESDADVVQISRQLQLLYRAHGEFPDQSLFTVEREPKASQTSQYVGLTDLKKKYQIDAYSNAGAAEVFVYLKRNCKIRVTPERFDVYPR